ncbi:MAG: hypothetical protein HY268_15235 [Deltaproteobacteria bacterium]|nr:hypothetical protein [Deltaproteobacteria bacterium]
MKQLLMLAIMALFLILVDGWGQQASAQVDIDHYKCYAVKGQALKPAQTHTVDDQFEKGETDTVSKPALICNPVIKVIPGRGTTNVTNPNSHLTCYQVKGTKKIDPAVTVQVQNQFGTQDLKVATIENLLCVPSFKSCINDTNTCPNEH